MQSVISKVTHIPDLKLVLQLDDPNNRAIARIKYCSQWRLVPVEALARDTVVLTVIKYTQTHPENLI